MSQSTRHPAPGCQPAADAQATLLAQHEGLVHWVARQQRLGPLSFADALHEGRIGLWQAIRHYDPARGTTFSTYAVPAITHAIWRAVAREQTPLRAGPATALVAPDDLSDRLHTAALAPIVRAAVAQLPSPLPEVVVTHLGLDGQPPQSFAAIGARLGRTKQRAHQLYVDALERLAHPAHSLPLRRLSDRLSRADYQRTGARQRQRARARRGLR